MNTVTPLLASTVVPFILNEVNPTPYQDDWAEIEQIIQTERLKEHQYQVERDALNELAVDALQNIDRSVVYDAVAREVVETNFPSVGAVTQARSKVTDSIVDEALMRILGVQFVTNIPPNAPNSDIFMGAVAGPSNAFPEIVVEPPNASIENFAGPSQASFEVGTEPPFIREEAVAGPSRDPIDPINSIGHDSGFPLFDFETQGVSMDIEGSAATCLSGEPLFDDGDLLAMFGGLNEAGSLDAYVKAFLGPTNPQ